MAQSTEGAALIIEIVCAELKLSKKRAGAHIRLPHWLRQPVAAVRKSKTHCRLQPGAKEVPRGCEKMRLRAAWQEQESGKPSRKDGEK